MTNPNEHIATVKPAENYRNVKRKQVGNGADVLLGIGEGMPEIQSYRFSLTVYTEKEAKAWLKKNGVKTISFERAANDKSGKAKK